MTENPDTGNNAGMAREDDVDGLDVFPSIPFPIAPASGLYTYSNVFTLPLPPVPVPYPVVPPGPIPPRPGGVAQEKKPSGVALSGTIRATPSVRCRSSRSSKGRICGWMSTEISLR